MSRRSAGERRALGLWSAGWLALFLVAGLAWVGAGAGQWALLLLPVGWAALAVRRGGAGDG